MKLGHLFPAVIEESQRVRAELGHPIMVTPFPQMVMSQALFNVIGTARYGQISDQVLRYVLGKFGRPTSAVDPAVEAAILDRPRAREIEQEEKFPALADLKKRFGANMDKRSSCCARSCPAIRSIQCLPPGRRGRPTRPKPRRS